MVKKLAVAGSLCFALGWPTFSWADSDTDRTIRLIGVNATINRAYVASATNTPPSNTSCGIYYSIDLSTVPGRAQYAAVVAAKVAGKKMSRIDYTFALPAGYCTVSLLEISD